MCGIVGIVSKRISESEKQASIRQMAERIAHRGPDGEGYFCDKFVALGHKRLSIIDVKLGHQPKFSSDNRYVIVFNGEIYNYIELKEQLQLEGTRFETASDSEVLLQMLIRFSIGALPKLVGMFAFFFYDTQTQEWLMARDPMGIKPLYYSKQGDDLFFASEIKALLVRPELNAQINQEGLEEYLTFQLSLGEKTLFRDIYKLEPAFFMKGQGSEIKEKKSYWDLAFEIDSGITESQWVEKLQSLLEDSIRMQVRSDVPVGAYLSGGLDSSTVAALTRRALPDSKLTAFIGRFEEGAEFDEYEYAKAVADANRIDLQVVTPTEADFVESLPKLVYHMDEPAAGPGLFPQYFVSQLASKSVKVALGGQGGDEIFAGYARYLVAYLEQAMKGAIFQTQEEGQHIVSLSSIVPNLPLLRRYGSLMQNFWRDGLFEDMDLRYFRMIDRSPDLHLMLNNDFKSSLHHENLIERFREIFNAPKTSSYVNKMCCFDLKTLLPALLQVEDRVSMAASIESRVPLLDHRIVELVAAMPPAIKFAGGQSKHIFREAAKNWVPKVILDRKDKMGFPVPLNKWIQRNPVKGFIKDILLDSRTKERGIFFTPGLERMLSTEATFDRQIWGALCLELWCREFLDR
ncbi:MAG: asparagine synthase (glutamine-hydrolyzing) [Deltaproteobacteria bacterium CG11_big_fil_rev_8_21_14_0_20_45_16]|nr:MAG: asparagine synthase (glutamine-hydrolyzing) [Deltaproteobacteria bacterium CG11_big_fil_rev_8_21_14_0_20_45_16]